jgi:hypothetical protein
MNSPRIGTLSIRLHSLLVGVATLCSLAIFASLVQAQPARRFQPPPQKPVAPPAPRSSLLTSDAWRSAPRTPVTPEEIDQLVAHELTEAKIDPAPLTSDEQFLRRVSLDVTGKLLTPAEVEQFLADRDPQKRARLIDRLLQSDDYASHWARYWRDVIESRITEPRGRILAKAFEEWMTDQLNANKSWAEIARALITAEGQIRFGQLEQNKEGGAAFFLASHLGAAAADERAAETSRVFLGIRIQCAQCHNHPFDQWKQVQFHELAAYYARLRERQIRENQMAVGLELFSAPRGEHEMPSKEDPKKTFLTHPRFLDGRSPGQDLSDKVRRDALARAIVDKNNYWFAGAYVNRIWGVLLGQSFYEPVDDMGPGKEVLFAPVLVRLAASFQATEYDMKALLRAILNSQTYQRQIRPGDATDSHLHFAASCPTRLQPDALWGALLEALGGLNLPAAPIRQAGPAAAARLGPRAGLEALFKSEFAYDPSQKADEVEGSIPQALMLMNGRPFNQRMLARGENPLVQILKDHPENDDALRTLYLRTLARKPTDRERDKCLNYIRTAATRAEAFEDIFWALINSTEFQMKR